MGNVSELVSAQMSFQGVGRSNALVYTHWLSGRVDGSWVTMSTETLKLLGVKLP